MTNWTPSLEAVQGARDYEHYLELMAAAQRKEDAKLRPQQRPVGPCPCECNSGGFCGGCGHAGCAGRRR